MLLPWARKSSMIAPVSLFNKFLDTLTRETVPLVKTLLLLIGSFNKSIREVLLAKTTEG